MSLKSKNGDQIWPPSSGRFTITSKTKKRLFSNFLKTHSPATSSGPKLIAEFEAYRAVLRVLAQRLEPHDPVSPRHASSQPIRERSVAVFDSVVSRCLPNLDLNTKRQLARALWLQHLLILGVWSFDRSPHENETEAILKQSIRLWKPIPTLVRVPGMKTVFNRVLSPLERLETKQE